MKEIFFNESTARNFLRNNNLNNRIPYHLSLRQLGVVYLLNQIKSYGVDFSEYSNCIDCTNHISYINRFKRMHEVACDHAKLSLFLLENKMIDEAFVSDIAPEPLNRAKRNLSHFSNRDTANVFLSDGLDKHSIKNEDVTVLAGIGGYTAISIIRNLLLFKDLKNINELYFIIQVQSREVELYYYMDSLGINLLNQVFAYENKFIYDIRLCKLSDYIYAREQCEQLDFPFINNRINDDFYNQLVNMNYKVKFKDLFLWDENTVFSLKINEKEILYRYFSKYSKYFSDIRNRFINKENIVQFIDRVLSEIEEVKMNFK